jgi:UDP-N-acetylglucosamine acyltransferase
MKTQILKKTEIHPTAVIHPWARIGEGVKIGPYTVIGENVEIGDECEISSNVLIEGATKVGKRNRFFHGASVGTAPQDLKYHGETTYLTIGDDNVFREFTTLNLDGRGEPRGGQRLPVAAMSTSHLLGGDEVILANREPGWSRAHRRFAPWEG